MGATERINKMLAFSLVSKVIEEGPKLGKESSVNKWSPDISFKDLEVLYQETLKEVESSSDIREEVVNSLKEYQKEHGDLNQLYSSSDIADDPDLQSIFLEDYQ